MEARAAVPEPLAEVLLGGEHALLAVLDGAKLPGLTEMCARDGLQHTCLYTGVTFEEYADVAPWLVALTPDCRLLRNLMTDGDAPWHLWRKQMGVFLRSAHTFDQVWAHLRRYTLVPDDHGDRLFFRFFEPDFITTVLRESEPGEVAGFFAKIDRLIAIEQHWPDVWAAAATGVAGHDIKPTPFVLTERKWRAMQHVDRIRKARKACLEHGLPEPDREDFVTLAVWLQGYKHTFDKHWVEAYQTFRQIDASHMAPVWKTIADGQHSMGYILYEVRKQFGLERQPV